jgi:hypothetical protein
VDRVVPCLQKPSTTVASDSASLSTRRFSSSPRPCSVPALISTFKAVEFLVLGSQQSFSLWKKKYAGLGLSELRELCQLRDQNCKVKRLGADLRLGRVPERKVEYELAPQHTQVL